MNTATLPILQQKFRETEISMATWNLERSEPIRTALLALVSKQHCFYYGKPGIAKSYLVRTLHQHIGDFQRGDWFEKLLTPFMTDADIFGGIDMVAIDNSIQRRRTEHYTLAIARIAFLDEVNKAGGPLLNTMLKALNEREFDNDVTVKLPLWSVFSASNEFAQGDETEAFADRLTFWHVFDRIKDSSTFVRMLMLDDEPTITPTLTIADIEAAQEQVKLVKVEVEVAEALESIRQSLHGEGIEPTDRRIRTAVKVARATAWMRGSEVATIDDIHNARFMFWHRPEDIPIVDTHILQLASPLDAEALKMGEERIFPLVAEIEKLLSNTSELTLPQRQKQAISLHRSALEADKDLSDLSARIDSKGRTSEQLDRVTDTLDRAQASLLSEMFKIKDSKGKATRG